jgi:SAM-dependent methyltransferase
MNWIHNRLCTSAHWREKVRTQLVPWGIEGVDLGSDLLEIGPGPGFTTELLRSRSARITAVELHHGLATRLSQRLQGTNVRIVEGDGCALPFPGGSFSAAACFTMLHHIPTAELQDCLFRDVHRVLRPQSVFCGTDSLGNSWLMPLLHIGDTMNLLNPQTLGSRLEACGFRNVSVETGPRMLRFRAYRA